MSDDPQAPQQPQPPERAAPSVWAYRGSIAALVLGSFLALFLVLRPPETESRAGPLRPAVSTPEATAEPTSTPRATPTPRPEATPAPATPTPSTPEPTPVATPEPTPTPQATPAPGPAAFDYTINEGDTLIAIAVTFDTTLDAILELNPGLDPDTLQIGQIILVPRP